MESWSFLLVSFLVLSGGFSHHKTNNIVSGASYSDHFLECGSFSSASISSASPVFGRNHLNSQETHTTEESLSSLESPKQSILSYNFITRRLKLLEFRGSDVEFDRSRPIDANKVAALIAYNYAQAAFDKLRRTWKRKSEVLNLNVLYDLMREDEIVALLGYKLCIHILLRNVMSLMHSHVSFDSRNEDKLEWSKSVAQTISDFIEFIVLRLIPKQQEGEAFDLTTACETDLPSLVMFNDVVGIHMIILLREPEILQSYLDRFKNVWPASVTETYVDYALRNFKNQPIDNLTQESYCLRDIIVMMVERVPEFFVSPHFVHYFDLRFVQKDSGFAAALVHMTPILRALFLSDSKASICNYLARYHAQMFPPETFPNPKEARFSTRGTPLAILNVFVRESHFALSVSAEQFELKQKLFAMILSMFFGVSEDKTYLIALHCLNLRLVPLYEAILKYFPSSSANFSTQEKINLISYAGSNAKLFNSPLLVTAINMAYLPFNTDFVPFTKGLRTSIRNADLSRAIKEIIWLLDDCPVKEDKRSIVVGDEEDFVFSVFWPCPFFLCRSEKALKSPKYPHLFSYAQVILHRKFGIPFFNVSGFENWFLESANWREMISFMNLIIERMAQFSGIDESVRLFRFSDVEIGTETLKVSSVSSK
jgi:hypothetical protein